MKKVLIIIGMVLGVFIVLFDASLEYADTAPVDDNFGLSFSNTPIFIFRLIAISLLGGLIGWGVYKVLKKIFKKTTKS